MADRGPLSPAGLRGWRERGLIGAFAVALWAGLVPGPGLTDGVPNAESLALEAALTALDQRLGDPDAVALHATQLIAEAGIAGYVAPTPDAALRLPLVVAEGTVEALALDLRLGLAMMSQAYGDEGNFSVLTAQSDPARRALTVRSGQVTLAGLAALLTAEGLQEAGPGPVLTLRVPVVLWPGASLVMGPGEVLELSRPDGAILMNFGHLAMSGATIRAVGGENPRVRSFVPFVVTAEGGTLDLHGATIEGLGFGETLKFAGFVVLRSLLRRPQSPVRIDDSLFRAVQTVAIVGDRGARLQGNVFQDPDGPALVIVRAEDVVVAGNIFAGVMPTNAIRAEGGSRNLQILGNVILGGDRAGIIVRAGSHHARLEGNVIWNRDGGGIALVEANCGHIADNLVIGNAQKGIEVRTSLDVAVADNRIYSNHSAGLWISAQPGTAVTWISGNRIAFNGSGLATAEGAALHLAGNDFSRQFTQFLSGDLTQQSPYLARDLANAVPVVLTAAGVLPDVPPLSEACAP